MCCVFLFIYLFITTVRLWVFLNLSVTSAAINPCVLSACNSVSEGNKSLAPLIRSLYYSSISIWHSSSVCLLFLSRCGHLPVWSQHPEQFSPHSSKILQVHQHFVLLKSCFTEEILIGTTRTGRNGADFLKMRLSETRICGLGGNELHACQCFYEDDGIYSDEKLKWRKISQIISLGLGLNNSRVYTSRKCASQ